MLSHDKGIQDALLNAVGHATYRAGVRAEETRRMGESEAQVAQEMQDRKKGPQN